MKIQSNSIRSAINEFQQDAKPTKATKKVLPETNNPPAPDQFATAIKSEQSFTAMMRVNELQSQLVKVDVEIKEVMTAIDKREQQEKEVQDRVQNQQDQGNRISENLDKAADSYTSILDSTKLD